MKKIVKIRGENDAFVIYQKIRRPVMGRLKLFKYKDFYYQPFCCCILGFFAITSLPGNGKYSCLPALKPKV